MKRKYLSMALAVMMMGSIFTGCGSKGDGAKGDKVQITYTNWNLGTEEENNIERRMIEEYEKQNPNVDIVIADYIDTSDYGNSLTTAAAGGKLPDVVMLQNIPTGLSNEWLMDITEFTKDDADWKKISEPVREATKAGEGTYAVPAGQFLVGYMVNKDLFEKENVKSLELGYTLEEFEAAIKAMSQPSKNIIGLANELEIVEWYAAVKNDNTNWYTYDGEKYNLTDAAHKEGLLKANSYAKNGYVYESLAEDVRSTFNGAHSQEVWLNGQIAVRYDGTWSANDLKNANFDYEFVGLPGGKNVIVNDFMGVSKNSANAEEAYNFAKWMTFSKEGTLKRVELCEANDLAWGSLPILNDSEVNDKFFAWNNIEGVQEAYENLDNSIVEGVKVIPGYLQSRWEAPTGIKIGDKENVNLSDLVFDMVRGTTNVEDYISQINDLANKSLEDAKASIKALAK